MSNDPGATPPPTPPPSPAPVPVDPKSAVSGPALALMVVGGLDILYVGYVILRRLLGFGVGALTGQLTFLNTAVTGTGALFSIVINLVLGGLIFYGAMQMKDLKNYNMAIAASIAAMIPCSCCCCVGIAVGIWSLVILMKPEVKAAFGAGGGGVPVT